MRPVQPTIRKVRQPVPKKYCAAGMRLVIIIFYTVTREGEIRSMSTDSWPDSDALEIPDQKYMNNEKRPHFSMRPFFMEN